MTVDCMIEDRRWDGLGLDAIAAAAAGAVTRHMGLPDDSVEISLLGCNDARIAVLNADFRGKPQPTNVLSWPSEERGATEPGGLPRPVVIPAGPPVELGDIAIAWETCAREAKESGLAMADHTTHLIVHGVLHLMGYDHERDADADLMEGIESEILGQMGIANPYKLVEQ